MWRTLATLSLQRDPLATNVPAQRQTSECLHELADHYGCLRQYGEQQPDLPEHGPAGDGHDAEQAAAAVPAGEQRPLDGGGPPPDGPQ